MHGRVDALVSARDLAKHFGKRTAVCGIDFDVGRGEAFGFLGANAAGKSSTMRMIGCVSTPSAGSLRVLGLDPVRDGPAIRARLGVCPQQDSLDVELTVIQNLIVYARYFRIPRSVARRRSLELLEFLRLEDRADERVQALSGGMRRRLSIARALVNEPTILLLDEPTTGLDPQARHLVWERLTELKRRGVTILLTTHYMDEAEQLCDRLVVMDAGKIIAEGEPRELIERYSSREVVELWFTADQMDCFVSKLAGLGERAEVLSDRILLYTGDGDVTAAEARRRLSATSRMVVRSSTLEDVFLHLSGRTLVD